MCVYIIENSLTKKVSFFVVNVYYFYLYCCQEEAWFLSIHTYIPTYVNTFKCNNVHMCVYVCIFIIQYENYANSCAHRQRLALRQSGVRKGGSVCMYIDTFTRTHTLTRLCVWVCVFGRRPVHRCERAVLMAVCMYVHACVRVFNSLHTITHTDIM